MQFQKVLVTVPNHPLAYSGLQMTYAVMGMPEEVLAASRSFYEVIGFTQAEEALALGYAEGGYRGAMRRAADTWADLSSVTWVPPMEIATLYTFAGENSLALDWMERSFEERDPNMPYMSSLRYLSRLRDEPRFQDLLRRMNLPQ